jgi:hypothetical protein
MSSKKDKGQTKDQAKSQSRRALIAGVAAGAALPILTKTASAQGMMMGNPGTRYVVDLGGVRLPDRLGDELEAQIRRAVLSAVARAYPRQKFVPGPLGPGIRGIVIRPQDFRGGFQPR